MRESTSRILPLPFSIACVEGEAAAVEVILGCAFAKGAKVNELVSRASEQRGVLVEARRIPWYTRQNPATTPIREV